MLELQNIGYAVEEGNTRKEILKIYPLRSVLIKESVLHFSSRSVLRD